MFDFSSGELLVIAVAALILIKPKDLPGVLRAVGQWTGKIRRMAGEFQDQFREAMREAEMADLKKDIDTATSKMTEGLDPFHDAKDAAEWKPADVATPTTPPSADGPPVPPAEASTPAEPAPATTEAATTEAAPPSHEAATGEPASAPPAGGDKAA